MRNIKLIVKNLVKKHSSRDPFLLAKYCKLHVHEHLLPQNINGIYINMRRYKAIILNASLDDWMKNLVVAHELGHHILHNNINQVFLLTKTHLHTKLYETEADKFAVELLFPDDQLVHTEAALAFEHIAISETAASYLIDLKAK